MVLTLHAIIVKKPIELETAKDIAMHFTKKKYYRETSKSYRFRHYPKTAFEPNSFQTKKLSKNVSLVFGKHKKGKDAIISGSGLWDDMVKKVQNFILKYNPVSLGIKSMLSDKPKLKGMYDSFENKMTN